MLFSTEPVVADFPLSATISPHLAPHGGRYGTGDPGGKQGKGSRCPSLLRYGAAQPECRHIPQLRTRFTFVAVLLFRIQHCHVTSTHPPSVCQEHRAASGHRQATQRVASCDSSAVSGTIARDTQPHVLSVLSVRQHAYAGADAGRMPDCAVLTQQRDDRVGNAASPHSEHRQNRIGKHSHRSH